MWEPNQEHDFGEDYKRGNITGRIPNFTPEMQPQGRLACMHVWNLIEFDYEALEPLVDTVREVQKHQRFRIIKDRPKSSYTVSLTLTATSGTIHSEGRKQETHNE